MRSYPKVSFHKAVRRENLRRNSSVKKKRIQRRTLIHGTQQFYKYLAKNIISDNGGNSIAYQQDFMGNNGNLYRWSIASFSDESKCVTSIYKKGNTFLIRLTEVRKRSNKERLIFDVLLSPEAICALKSLFETIIDKYASRSNG